MRLVLMRHAEAGEADPARWPDDRRRPLTDAGRCQHACVAAALRHMGVGFDRILTSPLARARETAEITARIYGGAPSPEPTELLGDRADPAAIAGGLASGGGPAGLLCVGHEPTLSRLAGLLIGCDGSARLEMPKSGIALIEFAGAAGPGRGILRLHLGPRELVPLLDGIRPAFDDVAAAVRRGGTVLAGGGTLAAEHPVRVRFARAMAPMMALAARGVVSVVEVEAAQPVRVLDVAAGPGMFGIAFAARHPRAETTALDWSEVLEVARENARAVGVEHRYRTIPGNVFEVDLGGPYDLVLLPNFLHHFGPPTCDALLARVRAALAPGGRAVTVEQIPGEADTFAQLDGMLRRAGFTRSDLRAPWPAGPQVIISHR